MISQNQSFTSRRVFLLTLASLGMIDSFLVDAFASIRAPNDAPSRQSLTHHGDKAIRRVASRQDRDWATTAGPFAPMRHACLFMASKDDDNNNNNNPKEPAGQNEWGVPLSSTLPPLVPSERRQRRSEHLPNGGHVTLLGSGPGDPDLLTVSAYRLLTTADPENTLVVADRLVSPEILQLINCPYKVARKLPGCADLAQEEIYWWSYQALNQGKHVIRLKIGDPFVFGRGGEEVLTFRDFGVEPKVVPGVSAAFSAPLLGNIPVTHRGSSNQVVMCTGYGREGTSPDLIQYHKEQTVVFLMAVGRLRELTHRLQTMAHYPADTPVAIVEKAGCPQQRTVVGDMTTIADLAEQYEVKPPSTIVVGDVVRVLWEDEEEEDGEIMGLIQNFTATNSSIYG